MSLFIVVHNVSAQNPDILWQKTLTKDTNPIKSISIAEGKYVAVLKGNEIVILDYNTGDSIKTFRKPNSDSYPNDLFIDTIFLGHYGDRLYTFVSAPSTAGTFYNDVYLRSWDISSGTVYKDIPMGSINYYGFYLVPIPKYLGVGKFTFSQSLNGKFVAVTSFSNCDFGYMPLYSIGGVSIRLFNTDDSTMVFNNFGPTSNSTYYFTRKGNGNSTYQSGKSGDALLSHSGNYLLNNLSCGYYTYGERIDQGWSASAGLVALSPLFPSYAYTSFIKKYLFSSNDDFLMFDNQLYDFPPTRPIRTVSKTGFVFLSDDNHMLAFKQADGVAAISNIETDTWEKKYKGDSLIENIIQINASLTAFATTTNNRITLWKIPADLQQANLTADFSLQKATFEIGDTIVCSNRTYPFKRGNHYYWNFGDGSPISKEIHPSHIFKDPGTYMVTLEALDTLGRVNTITKKVIVKNFKVSPLALWVNRSSSKAINSVRFSPDGNLLVSGSSDGSVKVWGFQKGELVNTVNTTSPISSALFMKDGKSVAVTQLLYMKSPDGIFISNDSYLDYYISYFSIWNFTGNTFSQKYSFAPQLVGTAEGPPKYVSIQNYSGVSELSGDNQTLLFGHRLTIDWCKETPDKVQSGKTPSFYTLAHYNDSRGNLIYYNTLTMNYRYQIPSVSPSISDPQFGAVHSLQICPNNLDYLSIIEYPKKEFSLLFRNIISDNILRQIPVTATSMRISPDKYHLLTNTGLWDIYDSVLIKKINLPKVFEYHPDGIHVFTLMPDSTIGIFNIITDSYEYFYPKQPTALTSLAVAPDGKHITSGSIDGYIVLWDIPVLLKPSIKADFNTALLNRKKLRTTDTVAFINTTLPVNNSFDFLWDFGDGSTSTERNPHHKYTKAGSYTVTMSVWQDGKMIDKISKHQYISIVGIVSAVEQETIGLLSNFSVVPNPSYGETTLSYTLSQPSPVQIRITDVLGREVSSWSLNEQVGEHSILWDGGAGAGMYYCTFSIGGIIRTLPFVVLR